MKLATVLRSLGAGVVVYAVMAACAAAEHAAPGHDDEEAGPSATSGGTSGKATSSSGSIADVLSDPVSEARAEPGPTFETSTESCSLTHGTMAYAEHSYPGLPAAELVFVAALAEAKNAPAGYTRAPVPVAWVKDGAVAVVCGAASAPAITSVTFVRRK